MREKQEATQGEIFVVEGLGVIFRVLFGTLCRCVNITEGKR